MSFQKRNKYALVCSDINKRGEGVNVPYKKPINEHRRHEGNRKSPPEPSEVTAAGEIHLRMLTLLAKLKEETGNLQSLKASSPKYLLNHPGRLNWMSLSRGWS